MIELIAHGSYWDPSRASYVATSYVFGIEESRWASHLKGAIRILPDELVKVVKDNPRRGTYLLFFAWEAYHQSNDYRLDWHARVEVLIKTGSYFGMNSQGAFDSFVRYPITVIMLPTPDRPPTASAPKYTLAQCWYAKEATDEAKRKALGEDAMEAVRALSRGNA